MSTLSSQSFVWNYFRASKDKDEATCTLCERKLKRAGGSTSGMLRHLETWHDKRPGAPPEPKRVRTMDEFMTSKASLGEKLAQMAACDGFSFNSIAKSNYLRTALLKEGHILPKNTAMISQHVRVFANIEKDKLAEKLSDLVKRGARFSLTLDEYTSSQNKRFLSVNLHGTNEYWNLGVVRVNGSMPAEKVKHNVEQQLQRFNLELDKHIVCCTTDGASVMVKFGKLVMPDLQLCFAHAAHLAVTDVLYQKKPLASEIVESGGEDDDDDEEDGSGTESEGNEVRVREEMFLSVEQVRKVARYFHKSPVSNDKLQECTKRDLGKELSLKLDCRTRWNSLADMLERYLLLHRPMTKTLVDINPSLIISDSQRDRIQQLVTCLKPLKMGVESLCQRDTTLVKADGIFMFMLGEMENQDTVLSREMGEALKNRFTERRLRGIVSLFRYLLDPAVLKTQSGTSEIFFMPSRQMLIKTATGLVERLFDSGDNQDDAEGTEEGMEGTSSSGGETFELETQPESQSEEQSTLAENLQMAISMITKPAPEVNEADLAKILTKEFSLFEATKTRPRHLQQLYDALTTIQATSVEAERAFSVCGHFVTKVRNRLSAESIDALCFLKAHFQKKKK